jgi:hypothetical protein
MEARAGEFAAIAETTVFLEYLKDFPEARQCGKVINPLVRIEGEQARTDDRRSLVDRLSSRDHRTLAPDTKPMQPKGVLTRVRMAILADDWLPKPPILHPWPNQRFAVKHPR